MRILIFQDYLRCGGTERQSLFLADYFKSKGHVVRLLTIRPGGLLQKEASARGVDCESLQPIDFRVDWFAFGLKRKVALFDPEVLLCMGRVANAYGGFLQDRFPRTAVIGTARTGKVLPSCNLRSFRRVGGVIVNSKWWESELIGLGLDSERVATIHNSCVLSRSIDLAGREAFRTSFGVCSDTCIFLSVASLRKGKRHQALIRAVASLGGGDPWVLWIVGAGPELRACRRLALSLGLGDRVRFFGYQEDPLPFYGAADVAVSASVEDSLPNFLVEAQMCGLPVVACDYRGVGECFLSGESGYLVDSDDIVGFSCRLKMLLQDTSLREHLSLSGKAWAADAFEPAAQGRVHLEFFEKICANR